MNEQQYRAVCEVCDRILLAPDSTIERVAIAWLHVLHEHPIILAKYSDLFGGKRTDSLIGVKSALLQARQWFKSRQRPYSSGGLPDRADVIFVSHLLNESQAGAAEDFYFGCLPETLKETGISSFVVLKNNTGIDPQYLSSRWPPNMAPRLLISNALSWREELALRKRLRQEAIHLRAEAKQSVTPLHQRVLVRAVKQAVSSSSIASLRFYQQIMSLVERLHPRAIVVTYEGHAWERMAFAAARRAVPEVRCIGYHHTIMFPNQHAAKRPLGAEFDPDTILTAGDITRDMFAQAKGLKGVKVATLGTHRRETHRVAQETRVGLPDGIPTCLVIPDGTVGECLFLFDFALTSAAAIPTIQFILRMHPVLPFASIAMRDPRLRSLPANVKVSDSSISEDFSRCRWAFYRGSNASIHAVLAGLRPFYVARLGEMSIDPLHAIHDWRCIVHTPAEFISRANLDLQSDMRILEAEAEGAIEYCNKYFKQTNLDALYYAFEN